jgi:hypothetical protein
MLALQQFVLTDELLDLLLPFVFFRFQKPSIGNLERLEANTPRRKQRSGVVRKDCRSDFGVRGLEGQRFLDMAIVRIGQIQQWRLLPMRIKVRKKGQYDPRVGVPQNHSLA